MFAELYKLHGVTRGMIQIKYQRPKSQPLYIISVQCIKILLSYYFFLELKRHTEKQNAGNWYSGQ